MTAIEGLVDSLEKITALDIDLTQSVYADFFSRNADARELMGYSDQSMRGRMLEQSFELLMDPSLQGEYQYFRWEISNHLTAYGVDKSMYVDFLEAIRDCIKVALKDQWLPSHDNAWRLRIQSLLDELALVV
jgi:hypothetical protein